MFSKGSKIMLCTIVAVSLMASIIGCGNVKSTTTTAQATEEQTTAAAVETTKAAEPAEISFQSWNISTEVFNEIYAIFQEDHPNIKVTYTGVPFTDHYTKMKVDLASGGGADGYQIQSGAPARQFREFIEPMEPLAKKALGDDFASRFIEIALEQSKVDGVLVGLPTGLLRAGSVWINKTMFDKYNLPVPKNYADMKAASDVFRKNKELPAFCFGAKDAWISYDVFMSIANDINRVKFYNALEGKEKWTDPEIVKAFEIYGNLFKDGIVQTGALGMSQYNDVTDLFAAGKAPGMPMGSWWLNSYTIGNPVYKKTAETVNFVAIQMPDMNGDGKACPLTANIDLLNVINKNSKQKDAVMEWIKFLTVGKGFQYFLDILWYAPTVKDMTSNVKEATQQLNDNLKAFSVMTDIAGARELPYPEISEALAKNLQAVAAGKLTPEKAAEAMEQASQTTKR